MDRNSIPNKMSTRNSNSKKVKAVKFHDTLTFNKKIYYSAELEFKDFAEKSKEDNPDWDDEFIKQVWMELCEEADKQGYVEYDDGECAEEWEQDNFEEILKECYVDDAVDKVKAKLKKD